MAEIDKSLPNDKRPDEVAEEVDVEEIEELKGPVEVTEDEEGATVDFDPSAMPLPCLLYTSPSPRDRQKSRMPSSA